MAVSSVTGELWEPGERANRGRGGATGKLGAGACCSRAAGGLVMSGRATGGDGHGARGNRVGACRAGEAKGHWEQGKRTRRTQSVLMRCRVTGEHVDYI